MEIEKLLIVDDEVSMRHMLQVLLTKEGYEVHVVNDGEAALELLSQERFDVILSDVRMPRMSGLEFLKALKARELEISVIMMSAYGSTDTALEAMKLGAYDYISKPFKTDEVILTLRKAEERERLRRENRSLKKAIQKEYQFHNIVAKSQAIHKIMKTVQKVADYKTTVLLSGESGTGKELVARSVHYDSGRSDRPFVAVNCGAIPENLLESELFGHVKGAFTDAGRNRRGLFEEAHGGTLFLDEIGELPLALQVKLLRVLQGEEIRRVGDTKEVKVDVRIVAATARDLHKEVQAGRFREDLFYRLNVVTILIPPLRDRKEDIPLLVQHFLNLYNQKLKTKIKRVSAEAMEILMNYQWPGNVRELENTMERAVVLCDGDVIGRENLPDKVLEAKDRIRLTLMSGELSIKKTSRIVEEELIIRALKKTGGNRTNAAKLLEISHRALLYKIKSYKINI